MAYSTINAAADLNAESPISEPLMVKLRDNIDGHTHTSGAGLQLTSSSIGSNALNNATLNNLIVGEVELGTNSIGLGDFDTGAITNDEFADNILRRGKLAGSSTQLSIACANGVDTVITTSGLLMLEPAPSGILYSTYFASWRLLTDDGNSAVSGNRAIFIHSTGSDLRVSNSSGSLVTIRFIKLG